MFGCKKKVLCEKFYWMFSSSIDDSKGYKRVYPAATIFKKCMCSFSIVFFYEDPINQLIPCLVIFFLFCCYVYIAKPFRATYNNYYALIIEIETFVIYGVYLLLIAY